MNKPHDHDERMAKMTFSSVYPHYVSKIESKGRTRAELHQVICWLTGFKEEEIQKSLDAALSFEDFFAKARLHPNASLIKGMICGYRIEEIDNPLTQKSTIP
jgi:hypothetical protein